MQDARCLKVKPRERAFKQFKSPALTVFSRTCARHEDMADSEVELHSTSALDGGEWTRPLYPKVNGSDYPLPRRLGRSESRSGQFGVRKIPCWESNHDSSVVKPAPKVTTVSPLSLHRCDELYILEPCIVIHIHENDRRDAHFS